MVNLDFIQGLFLGLLLIIAIGPQNLFVIQQGLKKNYIFTVCLVCSVSDTFLIIIGIMLSNYLADFSETLLMILKYIGSGWLFIYGISKIKNSFKLKINNINNKSDRFKNVILTVLAFTFLNPHVYLDTIILIGTISLNFESKVFFFSIGYFSKYLSKYFNSTKNWFIIDNIFGGLMIFYAVFFIYIA